MVDESPLSAENLPTDIQTLQQNIMDHLPTEHIQRSYLPKLRCEITDEILAQTNLALETIPMVNITETNTLIYATVRALQESVGQLSSSMLSGVHVKQATKKKKRVSTLNTPQCLAVTAGEEDQAIEIRCQQTQ